MATRPRNTVIPHFPSLDGIRGVLVVGILLFHAGHLAGAWISVDVFFVLSGFLITSLLVAEHEARGRISLLAFWGRRARRLLPALYATLLGVAAYAAFLARPEEIAQIRGDGLAALFYCANWRAVLSSHDYWSLFREPSPLQHAWSLAIEEQFYLLWPALVFALLHLARGTPRRIVVVAGTLTVVAVAWTAYVFDPGAGTTRVYYGTDTRAPALLIGAILAALLRAFVRRGPVATETGANRTADVVAGLGAAGLAVGCALLTGREPYVYRGVLPLLSCAAAAVIGGVVVAPAGVVARALNVAPLRRLGLISYGVYLWHWPLYVVLSPARVGLSGWSLTGIRVAASLLAAALSYRFLELPVRRGALGRGALPLAVGMIGVVAVALLGATRGVAPAPGQLGAAGAGAVAIGAEAPQADVLVLGDSIVLELARALHGESRRRGLRVAARALTNCGVLPAAGLRYRSGVVVDLLQCGQHRRRWEQALAARPPRAVVLVDGWAGAGDLNLDGAWRHPCEAPYDQALARAATTAVTTIANAGARPFLVAMPPASVPDLAAGSEQLWGSEGGAALERLVRERMTCQNRVRRQVAAATGAGLLDLEAFICPGGTCRRDHEGARLRPDGVHFQGRGAELVAGWLLDEVRRQGSGPAPGPRPR